MSLFGEILGRVAIEVLGEILGGGNGGSRRRPTGGRRRRR